MSAGVRPAWAGALVLALSAVAWLMLAPTVPQPPGPERVADKLGHVGLFAALGLLAAVAFPATARGWLVAALVAYGGVLELAQGPAGRSPDALDLVADAVGASAAWLIPRGPPEG